ncbi:hypothetical protein [Halomonas kalidii]|uniref:O-antigen polymerase n=1 Tax=Halomonas kalidii TaxID=3043293 RepID=A0ABT6VK71_9GAMM|nr:hypothetical protein [Halomonas kalidii]MDI5934370.1 hypothetical protein [Halomonas kalidii]
MLAYLWALGVFLSQFYVLPSGLPQPAHLLILLNFLLMAYFYSLNFHYQSYYERRTVLFLMAFCAYVVIANLVWMLMEQNPVFMKATIYWLYSVILFIFLLQALGDDHVRKSVAAAAFLSIAVLFLFWALGLGRYEVGSRYNGFFNDPNQMSFYVICVFSIFFYLVRGKGAGYLVFSLAVVSVILVFLTQSRSALLGVFFSLVAAYLRLNGEIAIGHGDRDKLVAIVIGLMAVPLVIYMIFSLDMAGAALSRLQSTDYGAQADIRGYSRLLHYPEYIFLGSGQGVDERFGTRHEIHSTWFGVMFYYGLAGFILFITFIARIFFRLDVAGKVAFLAPVLYGIATYGARTPVFWFFLASAVFAASAYETSSRSRSSRVGIR